MARHSTQDVHDAGKQRECFLSRVSFEESDAKQIEIQKITLQNIQIAQIVRFQWMKIDGKM